MITFINHASFIIEGNGKSILTDPWYEGEIFNKGWKLLIENETKDINNILDSIDYIWISHEHPDHFSISFFKKYKEKIIDNSIIILFQETKDKRVVNFLRNLSVNVIEIKENEEFKVEKNFALKIIKDEFYDSALIVNINNFIIFNTNDCNFQNINKIKQFYKKHGSCDLLLSQFSYAAWKGGKDNINWRKEAALEKLNSLYLQAQIFKSEFVIPIASYIYFANYNNFYLNDASNSPRNVVDFFNKKNKKNKKNKIIVLSNYQNFVPNQKRNHSNQKSLKFWDQIFENRNNLEKLEYTKSTNLDEIKNYFYKYRDRIKKNNSILFIKFLYIIKIGGFFQVNKIYLEDMNLGVKINLALGSFNLVSKEECYISMHSESFTFLMERSYGFDTLSVNGCFEEIRKNGFTNFTKTFAIENLNGMGLKFSPMLIFNISLIFNFLARLWSVKFKLKLKN